MAAPGAVRLRTAPELATLLLELGRLIRARRYYAPGDPKLATVFERSLRAWQADLLRRGPLDLELVAEGFQEYGGRGVLSHPRLAELGQDLAQRGVKRLRFEPSLDADAFAAFAEVLATDAGRTASRGGFAAALYAHSPAGILVNGVPASELPPAPSSAPPPAAAAALELEDDETAPLASASRRPARSSRCCCASSMRATARAATSTSRGARRCSPGAPSTKVATRTPSGSSSASRRM